MKLFVCLIALRLLIALLQKAMPQVMRQTSGGGHSGSQRQGGGRHSGTPNSTASAGSTGDSKGRDGDLLQQIDQFLSSDSEQQEPQGKMSEPVTSTAED